MVRLFGRHHKGKNPNTRGGNHNSSNDTSSDDPNHYRNDNNNNNNHNKKLRLSPSAALDYHNNDDDDDNNDDGIAPSIARHRRHSMSSSLTTTRPLSSPMYEYALEEYALAVAPGTSNDDGTKSSSSFHNKSTNPSPPLVTSPAIIPNASSMLRGVPIKRDTNTGSNDPSDENDVESGQNSHQIRNVPLSSSSSSLPQQPPPPPPQMPQPHPSQPPVRQMSYIPHHRTTTALSSSPSSTTSVSESAFTSTAAATQNSNAPSDDIRSYSETHPYPQQQYKTNPMYDTTGSSNSSHIRSAFESDRPEVTYEEVYGPAYIGGTIKYLYPTGYQSMRPRSCPWKLSIIVCVLFTWLSVFIVGHCSDQADESSAEAAAAAMANTASNGVITDDALVIEIRWCGSRLLYMMWATSMIVTGLSAAYCSVIGYIKIRDFAVANSRSQPPGMTEGKSDYYVRIRDHPPNDGGGGVDGSIGMIRKNTYGTDISYFQSTIYQADGTPQFWGAHIYRPTQAAVAVTSR